MVEINNQRKAFLDMLAWSEGIDNGRQKTRNHGYDVIVGGELFTGLLRSPPANLSLNPKLKSTGAGRYQLFPLRMLTASSLAWKTSLRKVRTLALQQIKERGASYLWLIVVISVRQSTVAAISGLHRRALVKVSSEYKADSLIAKFKEAGGTVRRLMYEQSHRDYLRPGYLHHRLPVMGQHSLPW